MKDMWIEKMDKFLDLHKLVQMLSQKHETEVQTLMETLLTAYVLTGCDSVSYLFHQGKRKPAKVALENVGKLNSLATFGNMDTTLDVDETIVGEARQLLVSLYGHTGFDSLDVLREHSFASSNGDLRSIPPTEDSFHLHLLRALYQLAMYKRAHMSDMNLPLPTEFGRKVMNGNLVPIMMLKEPRPKKTKPAFCKCLKSKCLRNCSCAAHSVQCIIACKCTGDPAKCGRVEEDSDDDN
jgi:hypothetical protein